MQIITVAFPWGISQPLSKDDDGATALRDRIKRFNFQKEHAILFAKGGALKSVAQIIQDCHAAKPNLRPTAAFITEQLFDIMVCGVVEAPPFPSASQAAKAVVLLALESLASGAVEAAPRLTLKHWPCLEQAHTEGDPIASMLLGRATWKELKPTSTE